MKYFALFCMIGILLFTFACTNDDENPIGYNLVKNNGELDTLLISSPIADTYFYTADNFRSKASNSNGYSPALYVGNWNGYTSRSLIKFTLHSAIALTDTTIYSNLLSIENAKLTLYRNQGTKSDDLGDGDVEISFHDILTDWDEYYCNWEDSDSDTIDTTWETPGGDYDPTPLFTATIPDSADTIEIELPEAVIMQWIHAYHDSTAYHNYGFIMIADNATAMKSFTTREYTPAENIDGTTPLKYTPEITFDYSYDSDGSVAYKYDVQPVLEKDAFIATKDFSWPEGNEETVCISNGFFVRSLMKFDIPSSLPVDATINLAELTLHIPPDDTESFSDDIFIRTYACKDEWQEDEVITEDLVLYVLEDELGNDISHGVNISPEDSTITLNINSWAQYWVNHPDENFGILFRSSSERLNFSSLSIYSRNAQEDKRPTLKLTYSLPPVYEW